MSLCLLRSSGSGGYLEVRLDAITNKTGDVWHVQLQGLKDVGTLCYGWRAGGAAEWAGEPRVLFACHSQGVLRLLIMFCVTVVFAIVFWFCRMACLPVCSAL